MSALTTLVRASGIARESGNLTPGHNVDLVVNSQEDTGPLVVEGEQVAGSVREQGSHREVVSITESMGDFLTWSVGGRDFWVPISASTQNLATARTGEPPQSDETADSVDSAPHRGTEGGPENTQANEQAAYRDVPTNENGAPQANPDPSTYRELARWDWVPDAIPSSGRRAAGLLAAGIVALVVLPVVAASGSSSSSTSSSDGGDR